MFRSETTRKMSGKGRLNGFYDEPIHRIPLGRYQLNARRGRGTQNVLRTQPGYELDIFSNVKSE